MELTVKFLNRGLSELQDCTESPIEKWNKSFYLENLKIPPQIAIRNLNGKELRVGSFTVIIDSI